MEWFEYPYPRPALMHTWSLAKHSEVMREKFDTEASKEKFDSGVRLLFESFHEGQGHVDLCYLFECLYAAVKMEKQEDKACQTRQAFTQLYSTGLHKFIAGYLHDPPCWKRSPNENEVVLYSLALVVDLSKCVLPSLDFEQEVDSKRLMNATAIVHSLIAAVDKDAPFHKLNKHKPLPSWILFHTHEYTKTVPNLSNSSHAHQTNRYLERTRSSSNDVHGDCNSRGCGCSLCRICPLESYLWINKLLEHFGSGSGISGFGEFLSLLVRAGQLQSPSLDVLQLCEAILQFLSKVMVFIKDEKKIAYLKPCLSFLGALQRWHKMKQLDEDSTEIITLIAQHLRSIFSSILPSEIAKAVLLNINGLLKLLIISCCHIHDDNTTPACSPTSASGATKPIRGATKRGEVAKKGMSHQMQEQLTQFMSEFLSQLAQTAQPGLTVTTTERCQACGGEGQFEESCSPSLLPENKVINEKIARQRWFATTSPTSLVSLGGGMRIICEEIVCEDMVPGGVRKPLSEFPATQVRGCSDDSSSRLRIPPHDSPAELLPADVDDLTHRNNGRPTI